MARIFTSINDLQPGEIRELYDGLDTPITSLDCGSKCAPHNPSGKPFCCDICHAVPAAYKGEWAYLKESTDLWHEWRGDECAADAAANRRRLEQETPRSMVLLACLGPDRCQRQFRALSCRQFPFFPYVSSDYRFLGLAYEWQFEQQCWAISHLERVSMRYRQEFVAAYDRLFALFQEEFEAYALYSERMRRAFTEQRRRFPLLHRNGLAYLVSPGSERMRRIDAGSLPCFGPYR
jgi:hypothetical protein